jgi:TPR repeat protein
VAIHTRKIQRYRFIRNEKFLNSTSSSVSPVQFAAISAEEFARKVAGDPHEAAQWITAAAEYGLAEAQALLGQILLDGRGIASDAAKARTWFEEAAQQGHLMGMNMLGRCHELGWGGPMDLAEAARWFHRAADKGLDCAMYNYANLLLHGNGVRKNERLALDWYRQSAARGYAKALGVLGRFYEEGWTVEPDRDKAIDYYRQSAEGGDFRGQYNYALIFAEQADMAQASFWMHKALDGAHLAFSRSMARNLQAMPHAEFQTIALEAFAKCCASDEAEDFYAYGMALLAAPQEEQRQLAGEWLQRAAERGHAGAAEFLRLPS